MGAGRLYYVKVVTRGATAVTAKGSPRQALDYITDGHDSRRDPGYSDAELAYIARMGEGWKTDLEGGRVPLVGLGALAGEVDEETMRAAFEESCLPHDRRATTGYKSITFTLPKEVSLFAEGHREKAKAAMYAAVLSALDQAFRDKDYTAVARHPHQERERRNPLSRPRPGREVRGRQDRRQEQREDAEPEQQERRQHRSPSAVGIKDRLEGVGRQGIQRTTGHCD